MVTTTTFGPSPVRQVPKKKPKPKLPLVPIILGILTVLALGVAGIFSIQASSARSQADILTAGMTQVAELAGVEGVTAETLADPAAVDASISAVTETLSGTIAQGEVAATERQQARDEVAQLRNNLTAANQQITTLEASTVSLQRDLAAREQDVASHVEKMASLQETHQAEIQELAAANAALNQQLAAANAALNQQLAAAAQPDVADDAMTLLEEPDAESEIEAMAEDMGEADAETNDTLAEQESEAVFGSAMDFEGRSRFFSSVTYDDVSGEMQFNLATGGTLTYQNVPQELVDQFQEAPMVDTLFMLRIYQEYMSDPNEREIIRALRR